MNEIEKILEERGKTHGDFEKNAMCSQRLKEVFRAPEFTFRELPREHQEALDMIAHKIARILNGNPSEVDHWQDIAGYALLVARIIKKAKEEWQKVMKEEMEYEIQKMERGINGI